jgi:hypothetical protein
MRSSNERGGRAEYLSTKSAQTPACAPPPQGGSLTKSIINPACFPHTSFIWTRVLPLSKNPSKDFCKNPAKDFCYGDLNKNPVKDFC